MEVFNAKDKFGVKENGIVVCKPIFDEVKLGGGANFVAKKNNKWAYFNGNNKLTPFIFQDAYPLKYNLAVVKYNNKWGYFNISRKFQSKNHHHYSDYKLMNNLHVFTNSYDNSKVIISFSGDKLFYDVDTIHILNEHFCFVKHIEQREYKKNIFSKKEIIEEVKYSLVNTNTTKSTATCNDPYKITYGLIHTTRRDGFKVFNSDGIEILDDIIKIKPVNSSTHICESNQKVNIIYNSNLVDVFSKPYTNHHSNDLILIKDDFHSMIIFKDHYEKYEHASFVNNEYIFTYSHNRGKLVSYNGNIVLDSIDAVGNHNAENIIVFRNHSYRYYDLVHKKYLTPSYSCFYGLIEVEEQIISSTSGSTNFFGKTFNKIMGGIVKTITSPVLAFGSIISKRNLFGSNKRISNPNTKIVEKPGLMINPEPFVDGLALVMSNTKESHSLLKGDSIWINVKDNQDFATFNFLTLDGKFLSSIWFTYVEKFNSTFTLGFKNGQCYKLTKEGVLTKLNNVYMSYKVGTTFVIQNNQHRYQLFTEDGNLLSENYDSFKEENGKVYALKNGKKITFSNLIIDEDTDKYLFY